jgi:TrmH family RNA methyltransferase
MTAITSTRNRRVVEARKLDQKKYRERQARFRVEGLQALTMALEAGFCPVEIFYSEEVCVSPQADYLLDEFRRRGAALLSVSAEVLAVLVDRKGSAGLVGIFPRCDAALDALAFRQDDLVLVLDRLHYPGNLGTLIRTADAVGAAAVILLEPCVDAYHPQAVRSSMGSLFNLPVLHTGDGPGTLTYLSEQGLRLVGADPHKGHPWGSGLWQGGVALILGNEGRGLSREVAACVEDRASLSMVGKAESLNVAVAGGVLMYAWLGTQLGTPPVEAACA